MAFLFLSASAAIPANQPRIAILVKPNKAIFNSLVEVTNDFKVLPHVAEALSATISPCAK